VPDPPLYTRPYFDSDVFIGWIKNEKIVTKGADGKPLLDPGGIPIVTERGKIAEHLLTLAEQRVFPVVISALTIAEVHKHKGKAKLEKDENQNVLDYFEHDFVSVVVVDRKIGEEANKLCRKYETDGLMPADAIHLACALRAGCDVLLSWDSTLNSIKGAGIRIENPKIWSPPPKPKVAEQMPLIKEEDSEPETKEAHPKPSIAVPSKDEGSDSASAEGKTGSESTKAVSAPDPGTSETK